MALTAHQDATTHRPPAAERPPARTDPAAPARTESLQRWVARASAGPPERWLARDVLTAQRIIGNTAVGRLLLIQRQPVPPPPPPPAVSPEDAQKQLYATAVTRDVHPIDAATKANVDRAVSFAPIYEDIEEKAKIQKDFDGTNKQLAEANNQLSIKTNNVKDVSGAPGGNGPGSDEPGRASVELEQAKKDVARLSEKAQQLADQLKAKQDVVSRELRAVGVKDEAELVTFVEETFPNAFVERGAQFATSALEANRAAALKEQERYKREHAGTGDRKGLQTAARDLDRRIKEIAAIQASRTTELPEGGADQDDPRVKEFAQIQAQVAPKQEELEKKRAAYQLQYPILFKADPQEIASASPQGLDRLINGPVDQIIKNIDSTEADIDSRSLKIWKLKGKGVDIPALTKRDLGIKPGSTLDSIVDRFAADDKTAPEKVTDALNALSMIADSIAVVTGPVGVAVAAGVNAVAAIANIAVDYKTFTQAQAAGNVALDPQFQAMIDQEQGSGLDGLMFDLVRLGLSLAGIKAAIAAFKAAKAAAAAAKTAAADARQAISELERFKKSINGTSLDGPTKERLIAEAERQFAAQPKLVLGNARQVSNELVAVGQSASDAAKVRIGRIIDKYEADAFTKSFLELSHNGRIRSLDADSLRSAGLPEGKLSEYMAKYIDGPNASKYPGFVHPGPPRTIFLKPATENALSSALTHELVHEFQKSTGDAARFLKEAPFFYYQEHQAYLEQQNFLKRVVADQGIEVVAENERWLVNATREEITSHISKYPGAPGPSSKIPLNEDELGELLNDMLARNEQTRQRLILKRAEQMAGPR